MSGKPGDSRLRGRKAARLAAKVLWPGIVYFAAGFVVAALVYTRPWHQPAAWGDIPTWLAAFAATIGGAVALATLRGQAAVIKEDAEARRREQAAGVFISLSGRPPHLSQPFGTNASRFPVFNAQLWYKPDGDPGNLGEPEALGMIMPGQSQGTQRQMSEADALASVILTFRDADGVNWIRMPGGALREQTLSTVRDGVIAAITAA